MAEEQSETFEAMQEREQEIAVCRTRAPPSSWPPSVLELDSAFNTRSLYDEHIWHTWHTWHTW
jgi:hypothetical protein